MSNSKQYLMSILSQGSVTQGWGAVSVLNRGRLNRLLEQQYIKRFTRFSFIPHLSGRFEIGDNTGAYVELQSIALGKPLLSFSTASLTDSRALVTMNIISGVYSSTGNSNSPVNTQLLSITEGLGFRLEMEIDLSLVVGDIDRQGKINLNLNKAINFRCNMAADDEALNAKLADFFETRFMELPADRSVFELGTLGLKGYNLLTPTSFRILTQAAPGAKVRGARNYGDGGVAIFIKLAGSASGNFPPEGNFPFLIPDDKEVDGSERYSSVLVLAEEMRQHLDGDRLEVMDNFSFPSDHFFEPREQETPRDLVVFGNINPRQTFISLEPAFQTIKAGGTQAFTLRNSKGEVIQASRWNAVSLQSHTDEGNGTIVEGLYTAVSPSRIGHDTLRVVITAEYDVNDITYTASSELLVEFDAVKIAPRMTTWTPETSSSIGLTATAVNNHAVTWQLLEPQCGQLVGNQNQAHFEPDAWTRHKGLVVQQVEALADGKSRSSLVLVNAQQQLRVDPPNVAHSKNVALQDDKTLLPDASRQWRVVGGAGEVTADGQFTSPPEVTTSTSIVQCKIVHNGIVFASGYSVIDLSDMERAPTWKTLKSFIIKVPGGGGPYQNLGSLYRNGYQQLRVQVVAETERVTDEFGETHAYPLSAMEVQSMKLALPSGAHIEWVGEDQVGIPEGDPQIWRANKRANRFDLAVPRGAAQQERPVANAPPEPITSLEFYIHTRELAGKSDVIHAKFTKSDNAEQSTLHRNDVNKEITVTPLATPVSQDLAYTFERTRVDGGSGAPGDPEDDDFDFHLRTIDYWQLKFVGIPGMIEGTQFDTVELLPVKAGAIPNISSIRWESEQSAEEMFSWTGYMFQALPNVEDPKPVPPPITKIEFDKALAKVITGESLDVAINQSFFERGTLIISLHRSDRVPYVRSGIAERDKVSRDIAVRLIDRRGNAHLRRIAFGAPSVFGHRNKLTHSLFTPL